MFTVYVELPLYTCSRPLAPWIHHYFFLLQGSLDGTEVNTECVVEQLTNDTQYDILVKVKKSEVKDSITHCNNNFASKKKAFHLPLPSEPFA